MLLKRVKIEHIRSIKNLDWEWPEGKESGWHVIVGDNGSGKSTLLRSIALMLVEEKRVLSLRQNWSDWLSRGEKNGSIALDGSYDPKIDKNFVCGVGGPHNFFCKSQFSRESYQDGDRVVKSDPSLPQWDTLERGDGWFSASYGAFRRFIGREQENAKVFHSRVRVASHLSMFGDNVALTECLNWLKELRFKDLEQKPEGRLLCPIKSFVNQSDFLPHQARLESVSSEGVEFVDGSGRRLPVEALSDGYCSVLILALELIRQLAWAYGPEKVFDADEPTQVSMPGVVLIDEIDAHLHPTWQRRIGFWFRKHFPNLQFIVATHSPLICQAAESGTVWKLPKPGSDDKGGMVTGQALDRLVYGNILDAYSTEVFGENVTRSDASKANLQRLAELNMKELQSHLTASEQQEQERLRAAMPTSAHQAD